MLDLHIDGVTHIPTAVDVESVYGNLETDLLGVLW
jgi:hypothetical protein